MMRVLFDSVIIIDYLNGIAEAALQFDTYSPVISVVTYAEVLAVAVKRGNYDDVLAFLKSLEVVVMDQEIAAEAARVRMQRKLKLPEAIIYATAKLANLVLVTRNHKDFFESDAQIRIPYHLRR